MWALIEVQNDIDPDKQRRWLLAAGVRAMIEGCTDPKKLERWIMRAASAGSVGEVLGTTRQPRTARPRTKQRARR